MLNHIKPPFFPFISHDNPDLAPTWLLPSAPARRLAQRSSCATPGSCPRASRQAPCRGPWQPWRAWGDD